MTDFVLKPLVDVSGVLADWRSLYTHASNRSFFLSPAWIETWLSGAPRQAQLHVIEGTNNGRLMLLGVVADAPQRPPVLGLRETRFHEFGDHERDAVYIEYNDFLVADAAPDTIREKAIEFLVNQSEFRDAFVFRNLTNDMANAVRAVSMAAGCSMRVLREQPIYACRLGAGIFIEGLSRSLQSKVKRAMRLYEERGPLSGQVVSEGDFDIVWNKMTSLHADGWRARGQKSVFDNPHLVAFHERLRAAAPEHCQLFEVKAGEQTIAVLYNFIHWNRVMNYQSGFLFEDDNRLTPGFVAHVLAAEHYRKAGHDAYDLLAGEADYKTRLGEKETTLTSLVVERPTWRNKLRRAIKR